MERIPHLWARRDEAFRGLPDWSVGIMIRDEVLELEMVETTTVAIFTLVGQSCDGSFLALMRTGTQTPE